MTEHLGTYFLDEDGNSLGSIEGFLPIPLYKDMKVTLHGHGEFKVKEWEFHFGQPDEISGLRIILKPVSGGLNFSTISLKK